LIFLIEYSEQVEKGEEIVTVEQNHWGAKDYLEDVLGLYGMSKNLACLLIELIMYSKEEETLILNGYVKKNIAEKSNMSIGTIDNALSKWNEVGLLERLDRGTYILHPVLREARKLFESNSKATLKIIYHEKNRVITLEDQ
jgi:hypothetical protein